jgi:plasmid stabilization system protein ParE
MNARVSARAKNDLDTIFGGICARQGIEAADEFLGLARQAVGFLVQNPDAGPHPRWAVRHKTLRFWVISKTNFLIYYFHDELGVSIERVLDGRRDVARIMDRGLEELDSTKEE